MDADFSETSSQGYPSDDLGTAPRTDVQDLPLVWQQFLHDEPERFIVERENLLVLPDYLMALSTYYATHTTERHHLHKAQQQVIVAAFEGAVYDVLVEKLSH